MMTSVTNSQKLIVRNQDVLIVYQQKYRSSQSTDYWADDTIGDKYSTGRGIDPDKALSTEAISCNAEIYYLIFF